MNKIEDGCWIETGEGIAQVISSVNVYVEEYSSQFKTGKNVGEYLDTLVMYKVLCSHSGVIRKRNSTTYCTQRGVSPASSKAIQIVKKIQNNFAKEYEKFCNYKRKNALKHDITVWLNVPEEFVVTLVDHIKEFNTNLKCGFTYNELLAFMLVKVPTLEANQMHKGYSRPTNNLGLVLFNDDLKHSEKRAVFSKVKAFVK